MCTLGSFKSFIWRPLQFFMYLNNEYWACLTAIEGVDIFHQDVSIFHALNNDFCTCWTVSYEKLLNEYYVSNCYSDVFLLSMCSSQLFWETWTGLYSKFWIKKQFWIKSNPCFPKFFNVPPNFLESSFQFILRAILSLLLYFRYFCFIKLTLWKFRHNNKTNIYVLLRLCCVDLCLTVIYPILFYRHILIN